MSREAYQRAQRRQRERRCRCRRRTFTRTVPLRKNPRRARPKHSRDRVRMITDKEWSRRQAISAGRLRARLAKRIAAALMQHAVEELNPTTDTWEAVVKRVLVEEGY